jgi:hypothetical protein
MALADGSRISATGFQHAHPSWAGTAYLLTRPDRVHRQSDSLLFVLLLVERKAEENESMKPQPLSNLYLQTHQIHHWVYWVVGGKIKELKAQLNDDLRLFQRLKNID